MSAIGPPMSVGAVGRSSLGLLRSSTGEITSNELSITLPSDWGAVEQATSAVVMDARRANFDTREARIGQMIAHRVRDFESIGSELCAWYVFSRMTPPKEPPYRGLTNRPDGTAVLPAKTLAQYRPAHRGIVVAVVGSIWFGAVILTVLGKLLGVPLLGPLMALLLFVGIFRVLRRRTVAMVRAIEDSSALIARHEFDRAAEQLDTVATPFGTNSLLQAAIVHNRAVIESMRGNLDNAVLLFNPLLNTAPMKNPFAPLNDPTHANLALAYALLDRAKDAREALAKITGKGSQLQQIGVNRTVCSARLRLGETKEVIALYANQCNEWEHTLPVASMRVTALLRAFALSEQSPQETRTPEQEREIAQWLTYAGQPDRAATESFLLHWPQFRAFVHEREVSFR